MSLSSRVRQLFSPTLRILPRGEQQTPLDSNLRAQRRRVVAGRSRSLRVEYSWPILSRTWAVSGRFQGFLPRGERHVTLGLNFALAATERRCGPLSSLFRDGAHRRRPSPRKPSRHNCRNGVSADDTAKLGWFQASSKRFCPAACGMLLWDSSLREQRRHDVAGPSMPGGGERDRLWPTLSRNRVISGDFKHFAPRRAARYPWTQLCVSIGAMPCSLSRRRDTMVATIPTRHFLRRNSSTSAIPSSITDPTHASPPPSAQQAPSDVPITSVLTAGGQRTRLLQISRILTRLCREAAVRIVPAINASDPPSHTGFAAGGERTAEA